MSGVALPAIQAAAVGSDFELILEASLQRSYMCVKARLRNPLSCPVWAGRQERAVQHLKAFKIMRLWHWRLQLQTEEKTLMTWCCFQMKIQLFKVWCISCITLHMTWDMLEAVLITVTFSRLTRKADSSLCRSLSMVLTTSVTYISQTSLISTNGMLGRGLKG